MDLPKVTGEVTSAEIVPRSSDSLARTRTFKPKQENLTQYPPSLPPPPQGTWLGDLTGEMGRGCSLSPGLQKHRYGPLSHASFHPTPISLGSPISFLPAFASCQPCRWAAWGLSRKAKAGGRKQVVASRRAKAGQERQRPPAGSQRLLQCRARG